MGSLLWRFITINIARLVDYEYTFKTFSLSVYQYRHFIINLRPEIFLYNFKHVIEANFKNFPIAVI